jgi:hypothetical protein
MKARRFTEIVLWMLEKTSTYETKSCLDKYRKVYVKLNKN